MLAGAHTDAGKAWCQAGGGTGRGVRWSFMCKRNVLPHGCADKRSGLHHRMWCPAGHCYNKDSSRIYRRTLRFLKHWVSSVLALMWGIVAASGVAGGLLQAIEGQLASVGRVGAWRAAGVGAVRGG